MLLELISLVLLGVEFGPIDTLLLAGVVLADVATGAGEKFAGPSPL